MPPYLTCHFVKTRPKVSDSTDQPTPGAKGSSGAPAFTVIDAPREEISLHSSQTMWTALSGLQLSLQDARLVPRGHFHRRGRFDL